MNVPDNVGPFGGVLEVAVPDLAEHRTVGQMEEIGEGDLLDIALVHSTEAPLTAQILTSPPMYFCFERIVS